MPLFFTEPAYPMRTTAIGGRPMRFLKLKEVMEKTALSRSAIYRKMNEDQFPQSISLGDRAVAWVESEVDEWNIVGNGPGDLVLKKNEKVIRFNQPLTIASKADLVITNSKLAGIEKGFLVQGEVPSELFTEKLEANTKALESLLGCKPSLGLLAIKTMLEFGVTINISRMTLLPSLERPLDYDKRKALPAAYHNWLGERRLASGWMDKLNWPGYVMKLARHEPANDATTNRILSNLQSLPSIPKAEATELLKGLSEVKPLTWLEHIDYSSLIALESLFFVLRGRHISPNWWLYDNELSTEVNRLQKNLALAQQDLLFSEKVKA